MVKRYNVRHIPWPGARALVQIGPHDPVDPATVSDALVKVSGVVSPEEFLTIDRPSISREIFGAGAQGVVISIQAESRDAVQTPDDLETTDPLTTLRGRLQERFPDETRREMARGIIDKHFVSGP